MHLSRSRSHLHPHLGGRPTRTLAYTAERATNRIVYIHTPSLARACGVVARKGPLAPHIALRRHRKHVCQVARAQTASTASEFLAFVGKEQGARVAAAVDAEGEIDLRE